MRIWIGPSGEITDPPTDHHVISGYVCLVVMAACLLSWLVLLAACGLARRVLDRRRMSAWAAEWRASGPHWNGHHG